MTSLSFSPNGGYVVLTTAHRHSYFEAEQSFWMVPYTCANLTLGGFRPSNSWKVASKRTTVLPDFSNPVHVMYPPYLHQGCLRCQIFKILPQARSQGAHKPHSGSFNSALEANNGFGITVVTSPQSCSLVWCQPIVARRICFPEICGLYPDLP